MASLIQTLAVAEYLNFRHAANALGVSLSSVSTRGVRLTEAGRLFVERVAAGVDQLDHAVKTAGMAASGKCGRLRIGAHALIPRGFLAGLIERYRENHAGIKVEMTEGTARDAVMQLRADRLDIVFMAGTPELPHCHSRRIWIEALVAALPDRHPLVGQSTVTWADLAGETFLVRHGGTGPQVHDYIVALYMQETLGFTATRTGLGLLPMAAAFTLASAWGGPALIARVGTKPVVLGGMILFIAGLATLGVSLSADASLVASILPGTVIAGIGYGIAFPTWTVAGIEGVEAADHGLAGGMLTTTQEVGSAVGLAVGVAISVAVVASGGTAAQGSSSVILVLACLVTVGLISAAMILSGKPCQRTAA